MGAMPGLTIGWVPSPPTIPPGVSNRRRWLDAYICLQSSTLANITCINCHIHWSKALQSFTWIQSKERVFSQVLTAQSQRRMFDWMATKVLAESGWLCERVGGCVTSKFLHCLCTLLGSETAMSLKQCACACVFEHVCVFVCVRACVCVRQTGKRRMSETERQAFKCKSKRFYF